MELAVLRRTKERSRGMLMSASRSFAPHTRTGWVAVALGFGVIAVLLLLYLVTSGGTEGGSEAGPLWLGVAFHVIVLAVAVPAVILGFRSRRTDPSGLGTIALVIAAVIGAWFAFTGVVGLFI